jgi:hypothetical protein
MLPTAVPLRRSHPPRRIQRRTGFATLGLTIALASCLTAGVEDQPIDEYEVKAVFLYNFAKFISWPAESFVGKGNSIVFCVAGKGRFGHWLDDAVQGKTIDGHSLAVRHISGAGEANACHILFIGSGDDRSWRAGLPEIGKAGVLTVGESDTAAMAGVIVNFVLEGNKVRFDVNLDMADRDKLQISSKLLSLARTVKK